jgi:Mn2+/Fe2+ NRAMP family transporter
MCVSTALETRTVPEGRVARFGYYFKESGPAWLAGGLNIGGASVTNAVILAAATGFIFGWVIIPAVLAIWAAGYACVKISVVSGRNPIAVMRDGVHPAVAWANGVAIFLVNLVFHTVQVVLGAAALQILFPGLGIRAWGIAFVIVVALMALLPGRSRVVEKLLQLFLYILAATYLVALFVVPINWSGVGEMFTFTLPTSATEVLLFTAVLGSALAINVPTIQGYGSLARSWGVERLPLIRFETGLINLMLMFVSFAVIIVVGSTLYAEGIPATSAVAAAESLRPVTGDLSAVLFAVGLLGAVLTTAVVQTSVAGYVVSDLVRWPVRMTDKRFKAIQAAVLAVGISIPFFGWDPFVWVSWGAAFNSTFMPIGVATWWYLVNKKSLMGEHKAGRWLNAAMAFSLLVALAAAVRFWYVTLA